ncbi:MAG: hypothetical protein M1269_11395 [Chloroflexi bacterium]|nr:hypothetical protein [Chloroflexota bacterium]
MEQNNNFVVDMIDSGKNTISNALKYISYKASQLGGDGASDAKGTGDATDIAERQKAETLKDKTDVERQQTTDRNRQDVAVREESAKVSDRTSTSLGGKIETFLETRIQLKDVDKSKETNVENVEQKGLLDKVYDKFKEWTGKEFVVNDGKSFNYRVAENVLEDQDSFKNLSAGQKDRLLKLYESHPSDENLRLMENMAEDGRLNEGVISGLEKIDSTDLKLAEGIDRDALFNNALADVSDPTVISQEQKGTCAATSVQIALAAKNPGRYLETLSLLASESGDASSIAPGLVRTDESPISDTGDSRSLTTKIMAPAFMEYANGTDLTYKNSDNYNYDADGNKDHNGLYQSETTRLYNGVMNEDKAETIYVNDSNRDEQYKKVTGAVADGKPVPVGLTWYKTKERTQSEIDRIKKDTGIEDIAERKSGGHEVLLERIEKDPSDGKSYAYIINPWGEIDRMPEEDFKQSIHSATIPTTASNVSEAARQNDPRLAALIDIVQ